MKVLNTNQTVTAPEGVDISVKARVVTVKGPRGTLTKTFRHLAVDIYMLDKKTIKVKVIFEPKFDIFFVLNIALKLITVYYKWPLYAIAFFQVQISYTLGSRYPYMSRYPHKVGSR